MLGRLTDYKKRMADLRDTSTLPPLPSYVDLVKKKNVHVEAEPLADKVEPPRKSAAKTKEPQPSKKEKRTPFWIWPLVICLLLLCLWGGWRIMTEERSKQEMLINEAPAFIDSLITDTVADTLAQEESVEMTMEVPVKQEKVGTVLLLENPQSKEDSQLPMTEEGEIAEFESEDAINFLSEWIDFINDLPEGAGSKVYAVRLPSGYRLRDASVNSLSDWCRAVVVEDGLKIEWDECPNTEDMSDNVSVNLEDDVWKTLSRRGTVTLSFRRKTAQIDLLQSRRVRKIGKKAHVDSLRERTSNPTGLAINDTNKVENNQDSVNSVKESVLDTINKAMVLADDEGINN